MSTVLQSDNLQVLPYSIVELYEETMEGFATGIRQGIPQCNSLIEAAQRLADLTKEIGNEFVDEIENYKQKNVRGLEDSQYLDSDPYVGHEDMEWPSLNGQNNRKAVSSLV